ncbi:alpha/beta fold hydrolase [Brevibacillus sp. DP1.3A]|uniref:alpha/beta fold hydrolase n=1 Tax=Brevibacillus sp. DP1.3A TaxID=2738867 RepID=UPI00156B74CD|nr:alpha/beta hydrolase [Brevibacillus sp. DP1.3A]UED73357.1 alpha/beta hydrolase [Brevibacillus sp. DP1.3A]
MKKEVQLSNGIKIAYVEEGTGESLVLIHGFCGSSSYWHKLVPLLSKTNRVIAIDLRGHGNSSAPDESYSMERFADDLALFVDELGLAKIHLFGHSLGGYVTLAFANQYADKLASFGLIHSTPYPDDDTAKANRDKGADNIRQNGMEPFIKALVPKLFAPSHVETMREEVQLAKEIGFATNPVGAIQTLIAMRDRADRNHVLQETTLPVLLVAGTEDQIIPSEKTFTVDKNNVEQVLLPDVGHMGMVEAPEKMAEAFKSFLNRK